MIEKLTFRGHYDVTATYFKNDMVIPPSQGVYNVMVCDKDTCVNSYPLGWISLPKWKEKQIDLIGKVDIIEKLKKDILKENLPVCKIDEFTCLIDKIIYGI
jgi:hypothetical protein